MSEHEPQPDLQALRQHIEWLWDVYINEQTTERQRRVIGAEIDQVFERIKHDPVWLQAFLVTKVIGEE